MKNFLKIVSVYVGAFFLAQRACVAYIWLLFKYAFICIPNMGHHIRIVNNILVTNHMFNNYTQSFIWQTLNSKNTGIHFKHK